MDKQGGAAVTVFDRVTATPEALAELLGSLNVASGPWDDEFHRAYCANCEAENCDAENCPHNQQRGNPLWWLKQEG